MEMVVSRSVTVTCSYVGVGRGKTKRKSVLSLQPYDKIVDLFHFVQCCILIHKWAKTLDFESMWNNKIYVYLSLVPRHRPPKALGIFWELGVFFVIHNELFFTPSPSPPTRPPPLCPVYLFHLALPELHILYNQTVILGVRIFLSSVSYSSKWLNLRKIMKISEFVVG